MTNNHVTKLRCEICVSLEHDPPKFQILKRWFTNDFSNLGNQKVVYSVWSKRITMPMGRLGIAKITDTVKISSTTAAVS